MVCGLVIRYGGLGFLTFEQNVENFIHTGIERGFIQRAVNECIHDLCRGKTVGRRHFNVLACFQTVHNLIFCAPVGNDDPAEAPIVTKHIGQKPFIFCTVGTVETVVSIHHRPRFALFDGGFKTCKINFTQCSFVHHAVYGHTAGFLVIGGKVLERCAHAL